MVENHRIWIVCNRNGGTKKRRFVVSAHTKCQISNKKQHIWQIGDRLKGLLKAVYNLILVYRDSVAFNEISPIGVK
jgi:hypothetical protein